ncbi:MAG: hypothetical protein UHU19_07165 [Lachnospiraceae bacterium]|nr:hypothetical protein [Lachnospiraceae bacterium]
MIKIADWWLVWYDFFIIDERVKLMAEQRKLIIFNIIIFGLTLILSIVCEYIPLNTYIPLLSGHRSFYSGISVTFMTGALTGAILSWFNYRNLKDEHVINLYQLLVDIKCYIQNFEDLVEPGDKTYAILEQKKCEEWYSGIMESCDQCRNVSEILNHPRKNEKDVLVKIGKILNDIYKESNAMRDQLFINDNLNMTEKQISERLIGQKEYMLNKFEKRIQNVIDELIEVYDIRIFTLS